jgi:hypothetical protein
MNKKIFTLVAGVAALGLMLGFEIVPIDTAKNPQSAKRVETAVKDELDLWIEKLAQHENCPATGIIDTNHQVSWGILCFQYPTFKRYIRKYNLLPEVEDEELYNWIADSKLQKKLTKIMISDNYNNWRHWYNSVITRKLGKPPVAKYCYYEK